MESWIVAFLSAMPCHSIFLTFHTFTSIFYRAKHTILYPSPLSYHYIITSIYPPYLTGKQKNSLILP